MSQGFSIEVDDREVLAALNRLSGAVGNIQPLLQALGEDMMERTKRRFESGTAPDGSRWKPNARSTLEAVLDRTRGGVGKKGKISAKGSAVMMNKRPLIGESRDLSRQFHVRASAAEMVLSSSPVYAAIQQFGGRAGRGGRVLIPARPFLPVLPSGALYADEQRRVLDALREMLGRAVG